MTMDDWSTSVLGPLRPLQPTRTDLPIVQCPKCLSLKIRMHDNGYGGKMRWECQNQECKACWTEPRSLSVIRVFAVVTDGF